MTTLHAPPVPPVSRPGAVRPIVLPVQALVLDPDLRAALACVRSLGRRGRTVGVAVPEVATAAPAASSRWAGTRVPVVEVTAGALAFRDSLLAALERCPARVVVPCSDAAVENLRAERAVIETRTRIALAPEPALAIAVDKRQTLALATSLGIPVPRGVEVADVEQARAALAVTGLPAVVRPDRSWVVRAGVRDRMLCRAVTSVAELEQAVGAVIARGARVTIQQWVPGRREAVSFLCRDGVVHARFAQVAHRTSPALGGSSVLRESIPLPPDIDRAGEALVHAMGLEGYSEVEFRRDDAGRALLMEVNPRLSASVEVAMRSGVDFPALMVAAFAGDDLPPVRGYRVGTRMRWLGGDLRWLREAWGGRGQPDVPDRVHAVAAVVAETFRRSSYDYLDLRDPRPAIAAVRGLARTDVRPAALPPAEAGTGRDRCA